MEVVESPFLIAWHNAMLVGAVAMVLAGIGIYIFHKVKVTSIRDYHKKYFYISEKEVKAYKLVFICMGIAAAFVINRYGMGKLKTLEVWFFVRLFISIAGGTLIAYVAYLILEYYYPTLLNEKLRKWRYMPRINPKTGNTMRLLAEDEEDVHLQEGMKAEESAFSMDYDVWYDEASGDILVEKYPGHLQAQKCGNCGFFTMRVVREEITETATQDRPGELIKYFECSYCKAVRATAYKISNKEAEDYQREKAHFSSKDIVLVRVELHYSSSGETKFFEFGDLREAQKFLNEMDKEKTI